MYKRQRYDETMPLSEDMAGVAKGIAGLGALFYVAYRVWQSLARAEPIDVFPMLRPFAIGPVSYTHLDVYKRQDKDYPPFEGTK